MEFVMTNRTQRLIASLFAHPEISLERALLYTESHKRTEGEPTMIRRAKATARILDHVQISIRDDELIAGNRTIKPRAGIVSPRWTPTGYLTSWIGSRSVRRSLRHQRRRQAHLP